MRDFVTAAMSIWRISVGSRNPPSATDNTSLSKVYISVLLNGSAKTE